MTQHQVRDNLMQMINTNTEEKVTQSAGSVTRIRLFAKVGSRGEGYNLRLVHYIVHQSYRTPGQRDDEQTVASSAGHVADAPITDDKPRGCCETIKIYATGIAPSRILGNSARHHEGVLTADPR